MSELPLQAAHGPPEPELLLELLLLELDLEPELLELELELELIVPLELELELLLGTLRVAPLLLDPLLVAPLDELPPLPPPTKTQRPFWQAYPAAQGPAHVAGPASCWVAGEQPVKANAAAQAARRDEIFGMKPPKCSRNLPRTQPFAKNSLLPVDAAGEAA